MQNEKCKMQNAKCKNKLTTKGTKEHEGSEGQREKGKVQRKIE
jgi:hypothetical protein